MGDRRSVHIEFTPHAYWPGQPHSSPHRVQAATVFDQDPETVVQLLLRDLDKAPDTVRVAKSKSGGVAIVNTDGEPVPLAYMEAGITLEEASAALHALRTRYRRP